MDRIFKFSRSSRTGGTPQGLLREGHHARRAGPCPDAVGPASQPWIMLYLQPCPRQKEQRILRF
eukprot:583988-Hanusia_phi.AAC.1